MKSRLGEGNGHGKGLVDVQEVGKECVLLAPNREKPPPAEELHLALADVLQKWMLSQPIRVRQTLPITNEGRTVGIFVWFDPREDA
jgi:hypothetical protein